MGGELWQDHSPVLFPICGTLLDNKYEYGGREYSMKIHGFARHSLFEVVEQTDNSALLCLKYNEDTLALYPFKFLFYVQYTIEQKTVNVEYTVKNIDSGEIYFSFGGHEGYYLPCGVENYYLELDEPNTLYSCKLDGPYLSGSTEKVIENSTKIPLKSDSYRAYDLIFKDVNFSAITLFHNSGRKIVRQEFEGFPNLLVWSIEGGKFACIEAWHGTPDSVCDSADRNFAHKSGLIRLEPYKSFSRSHKFTVG